MCRDQGERSLGVRRATSVVTQCNPRLLLDRKLGSEGLTAQLKGKWGGEANRCLKERVGGLSYCAYSLRTEETRESVTVLGYEAMQQKSQDVLYHRGNIPRVHLSGSKRPHMYASIYTQPSQSLHNVRSYYGSLGGSANHTRARSICRPDIAGLSAGLGGACMS
jgi:hypothetical protein